MGLARRRHARIYEYRTTAQRTGLYLGRSRFEYGPEIEHLGVKAPQWCETTVYRHHSSGKIEFPVRRYFVEVVGTTEKNNVAKVNDRWARAPIQMLEKCTEAAALREAFPDEFGGEQTAEEIDGQHVIDVSSATEQIQPAQRLSQQTTTSTTTSTPAPSQAASATRVDGIPPQATSAPAGDAGAASGHGGNPTPGSNDDGTRAGRRDRRDQTTERPRLGATRQRVRRRHQRGATPTRCAPPRWRVTPACASSSSSSRQATRRSSCRASSRSSR
jgi:hypothetical protein